MTPRGSCDTALTEICDGARVGDPDVDEADVGELWPEAMEYVSGSRRTEMLDWLFLDLSDLRLGELGRALKTLSHLEDLILGSDGFAGMSEGCSAGVSSGRVFEADLLSMLRTWLKMGSLACRAVCGP